MLFLKLVKSLTKHRCLIVYHTSTMTFSTVFIHSVLTLHLLPLRNVRRSVTWVQHGHPRHYWGPETLLQRTADPPDDIRLLRHLPHSSKYVPMFES